VASRVESTYTKKEPINIVVKYKEQRNIEVRPTKKVIDNEVIPERKIIYNIYKVIKDNPEPEILLELRRDDPIIAIPKDLSCTKNKVSKEDMIEEMCCHGEAMRKLDDAVDENMMGGDMSLKTKIIYGRKKHLEKISFEEKKNKLEKYFKTNVDLILENKRIMSSVERNDMKWQE
jgi:hypothetical protein